MERLWPQVHGNNRFQHQTMTRLLGMLGDGGRVQKNRSGEFRRRGGPPGSTGKRLIL